MESDETLMMLGHPVLPSNTNINKIATLNPDEFNVRAEELALKQCQKGFVVKKEFMETDMLVTSCGDHIQGTPDGGFIDSEGRLRLVQVVRVPLLPEMTADTVGNTLYDTVLAKIVKSQAWMRATCTFPYEFIIFCWLPAVGAYRECLEHSDALLWTEALIWNVCNGGWPFLLKINVPNDEDHLFPQNFGLGNSLRFKKNYFNKLSYFIDPTEFSECECEDEPMEWFLFEESLAMENEVEGTSSTAVIDIVNWIHLAIQMVENRVDVDGLELQSVLNLLGIVGKEFCHNNWSLHPDITRLLDADPTPLLVHVGGLDCGRSIFTISDSPGIIQGRPWWGSKSKFGCAHGAFTPNLLLSPS